MHTSTTLLTLLGLASLQLSSASYTLQDDYSVGSFFSMFDFFTADDPTHGYVNYVDESTATASGLAGTKNGQIYMGVDSTNVAQGRGRNSVRITSKNSYNAGSLIILDLSHMPGSICGTWPAFWTVGANWPNNGEIDIIEGVNTQSYNHYALHTSSGCSISDTGLFSGSIETPNCDVNAAGQPNNAGCSIVTSDTTSYGDGFNAQQGGVYATEFTTTAISIWFFSRSSIPSDISSGSPNPATWGKPHASFGSPCQIGNFVKAQQIVFDTTFCGDWAGSVWSSDATCSAKAGSCQDFVQNNPSAFKESYWSINSLQVYSGSGKDGPVPQGSDSISQRPTISGGVPTGRSSFAPGGVPTNAPFAPQSQSQSFGAPPDPSVSSGQGQPQPQASGQPQQQSWDGNRDFGDRFTVSGWDGGEWGGGRPTGVRAFNAAVEPTADAAEPTATAGQFYGVSSEDDGSGAGAGAGAGEPTGAPANNVNVNKNFAAPTGAAAADSGAGDVPSTNTGTDSVGADGGEDGIPASETQGHSQPEPQDQGKPQPQNQSPPAADSLPPTITAGSAQPSKTCGSPWVRSSWSGRYLTVTAMGVEDFERAKRDVIHEEETTISKREAEGEGEGEKEEVEMKKRSLLESEEAARRQENQKRALREKEHFHVRRHGRKRGWGGIWKS